MRFETHAENMKEDSSVSLLLQSKDVLRKIGDAWRRGGQIDPEPSEMKDSPTLEVEWVYRCFYYYY